jgi:hypothetical protein
MIRYASILLSTIGAAAVASALAFADTAPVPAVDAAVVHETVIEKNSPFPVLGPLVVEECVKDDCSDLTS